MPTLSTDLPARAGLHPLTLTNLTRVAKALTPAVVLVAALAPSPVWADPAEDALDMGLVADTARQLVEKQAGTQVVQVVGLPRGKTAVRMEKRTAEELTRRRAAVAVLTAHDVGPSQATDAKTLAKAGAQLGADHVVVMRVMPNGGEVLVQLVTSAGPVASEVVRVGPLRSLLDEVSDARKTEAQVLAAFEREALRLSRKQSEDRAAVYARFPPPKINFRVYDGEDERLETEEALDRAGASDLATRHQLVDGFTKWSLPVGLFATFGTMLVGMGGGFLAGAAIPPAMLGVALGPPGASGDLELRLLGGLLGVLVGMLPSLAVALTWLIVEPTVRMFAVDEDEALDAITDHNRKTAEEVGLPRDEIPDDYLRF